VLLLLTIEGLGGAERGSPSANPTAPLAPSIFAAKPQKCAPRPRWLVLVRRAGNLPFDFILGKNLHFNQIFKKVFANPIIYDIISLISLA